MTVSPELHAVSVIASAFALDLAFGEYPARLHPVVWMGRAISWLDQRAPTRSRGAQLAYGTVMALVVPGAFAVGAHLLCGAARSSPLLSIAVEALLLKSTFALRALGEAAGTVASALRRGALDDARFELRALCSRDASRLDAPLVAAAAVESVAENASDSVVAPLLWWAVLGVPGAIAYRALNTLDARIGYHGRYEWLGKTSARLDDLLNLVPARLAAALLLAAGLLRRADVRRGLAVLRRDAGRTESPNAGRPMAAMAGLLGVELEKVGHYRLGDPVEPVTAETIRTAWRIASVAAVAAGALAAIVAVALAAGEGWRSVA